MKKITVEYGGRCLSCEERIEPGELVYWESGAGIWHPGCPKPPNLAVYQRERDRAKTLGQ